MSMRGVDDLRQVRLSDGRRLSYAVLGDPTGAPVIGLHGTPGSHLKFALADNDARRLGLRIVAPDRWGYGGSDAPRRPSLSAYAADMALLADEIGLERFSVLGISGGGPYAASVAARLGPRVRSLALVGPVGPIAGVPAGRALSGFHVLCFRVLPVVPGAIRAIFATFRGALRVAPGVAMRALAARAARADRALVCAPRTRAGLADAFRAGLAPGAGGTVIDMRLFSRPWDVRLGDVTAPTRVWLGSEDRNVPLAPARWLAAAIPKAELVRLDGHGHYWISDNVGEVLAWIAATDRTQARL
jgi:pimeloyl-ACP methyl ester carboxylesterase